MFRTTTRWTLLSGRQGVTVLHFDGGEPVAAQDVADATYDLWDALKGAVTTTTVARVDPIVEIVNKNTGALEDLVAVNQPAAVAGTVSGQQAADATQFLIRWNTGAVKNGRRVSGRLYLPGVPVGSLDGGNVKGTVLTSMASALGTWLSGHEAEGLVVWSRPSPTRVGQATLVASVSVWSELAVQRRRRTR